MLPRTSDIFQSALYALQSSFEVQIGTFIVLTEQFNEEIVGGKQPIVERKKNRRKNTRETDIFQILLNTG